MLSCLRLISSLMHCLHQRCSWSQSVFSDRSFIRNSFTLTNASWISQFTRPKYSIIVTSRTTVLNIIFICEWHFLNLWIQHKDVNIDLFCFYTAQFWLSKIWLHFCRIFIFQRSQISRWHFCGRKIFFGYLLVYFWIFFIAVVFVKKILYMTYFR